MAKASSILGLNARGTLYTYRYNPRKATKIAASKLLTSKILEKAGIQTPQIYAKFKGPEDIINFDWDSLPSSFVVKPNKGLGGEGIIVIKKRSKDKEAWITTQRERITVDDIKLHIQDIMEGAFSMGNTPDFVLIQEYVGRHKAFRKYAYRGTPDIRIIVFNKVPIMAMLRLPTKESGGRANLHQGAIGVGVDIATGITTKAIWHKKQIKRKPGTKRKLHGIKIPSWSEMLTMAVKAAETAGLGYCGADIVLHPKKGPMILELNSQPGLSIQLANMTGLKRRLDRIDELEVKDAEHGVKIAKALFVSSFADRVKAEEGVKTVNVFEEVKIRAKGGKKVKVEAKLDTGAWRSSIDEDMAEELGLLEEDNILWTKKVKSSMGKEKRPVINVIFWLKGRKIETSASVADRSKLRRQFIVGRRDLAGFLVEPIKE